jgi:thiosulfate/3-mercaptopyruvate sulfurtransferase
MGVEGRVNPDQLEQLMSEGDCVVFDCRFDLRHPQQGRNSWLASHIPGAVYAHLDDNLSGRVTALSGRHPLPNTRSFASFLARAGWAPGMNLVAYDAQGSAFAARLWWLMKFYGQPAALLDGGIHAWMTSLKPLESGEVKPQRKSLPSLRSNSAMTLSTAEVQAGLADGSILLLDARDAERFAGGNETIDPVAGHVPGAKNRPFSSNLGTGGGFREAASLKSEFARVARGHDYDQVVHMCGSGVTACHNLFAMEYSGLSGSRLYPGSWSEWIRDPRRPVEPVPQD